MSAKRVGDSAADKRPFRTGALVREITDRASSKRPQLPSKFSAFPYTAPNHPGTADPLPKDNELGLHYDTDWARGPGARVVRRALQSVALTPALRAITPSTILGLDRIEHLDAPAVFVANHHSHLDTGLLLSSLPPKFRNRAFVAAGADYFFDKRWKAVLSALTINAVPIERKKVSRKSADELLRLLRRDWSLVIFPEGGRSPDGWGQDFKPGAAFLAIRAGCPIVPVHIHGTADVLPKGKSIPKRNPSTVTFGTPIETSENDDPRELTERMFAAITLLGDEEASDWWTARQRAASNTSTALSGPIAASDWRRQWERTRRTAVKDARNEKGKRSWP
jgi:1-acyl-sn-glycerol-3-phosphate acyltransferase